MDLTEAKDIAEAERGRDADAILASLISDGRENPYPYYRALRRMGPVVPLAQGVPAHTRGTPASPYVAVATGHDVVDQVLRDPGFYKKRGPHWKDHPVLATFEASMMFSNPPEHSRYRQVFQRAFTPRRLAALEPIVERVVDDMLDRLADVGAGGKEFDFITEFAYPMPAHVMAAFLGLPEEDLDWYRARVRHIDAFLDLDGNTPQRLQAANEAALQLRDFYTALVAERRRHPHDDLVSLLVQGIDAGEHRITEFELISNLVVLFNASFLTTIFMLGSGMPLLLSRPDLVAALPHDPDLAVGCVNEIVRCESPVQFLNRAAPYDTELAGVPVRKDEVVLLLVGAANRDPDRFPDPDTFNPRRDTPSLAFGAGVHYCMGAAVARLEGRVALPKLFTRFPKLRIAGQPVGTGSLFLRGLETLPMTLS